jgi:hypothetical protein
VWCAVSSAGIVEADFLDNTVNAERYLKSLQGHFVSTPQCMGVNMWKQDEARPHTVYAVLNFLSEHFHVDDLEFDGLGHRTRPICIPVIFIIGIPEGQCLRKHST